jgi:nucleotide-binding universal stress UspA family protein
MNYKTILAHLDQGPRTPERLDLALRLAATFDAHLVGLFALSTPRIPSYAMAEAGASVIEAQKQFRAEAVRKAEGVFRAAVAKHGALKTEWRSTDWDALEAVRLSTRYSDLVVIGQRERGARYETGIAPDFVEELVLSAGRPVLLVPYAGSFTAFGERVLIAWNAGRESARAVVDALPLLARAKTVKVMVFDPQKRPADHGDIPGADIALYLARHGVKVSVSQQQCGDEHVGEQILSRASDEDSDLIVMGAYGHSRMRELVLGGVTRTLLESMTVPVLMSH